MVERASRLKITVLRRLKPEEVFTQSPAKHGPSEACHHYKDDQVFYVEEDGAMPDGFCDWAWNDLYKTVQTLRFGGNFPWFEEPNISISCCTEGRRPVIFKIERI